ncbi:MAG: DUF1127 domain-containing protein [Pseudomonadota bacterium]
MAHVQSIPAFSLVSEKVVVAVTRLCNALVRLSEANARVRKAERLHALSDEELGMLGITRQDIARHVFVGYL